MRPIPVQITLPALWTANTLHIADILYLIRSTHVPYNWLNKCRDMYCYTCKIMHIKMYFAGNKIRQNKTRFLSPMLCLRQLSVLPIKACVSSLLLTVSVTTLHEMRTRYLHV